MYRMDICDTNPKLLSYHAFCVRRLVLDNLQLSAGLCVRPRKALVPIMHRLNQLDSQIQPSDTAVGRTLFYFYPHFFHKNV